MRTEWNGLEVGIQHCDGVGAGVAEKSVIF